MKALYLLAFTVLIFGSCSRKWKQPTSCTFEMSYIDDNASAKNDVSAALYFTESIEFMGSREEAGDVFLSKSVNKQINGNSTETINFDLPQGTYSLLSTTLTLSRTSGASHSIRIVGKHYFDDGSFSNFQFDIDNEVAISGTCKEANGTNTIVLSKKIDRNATIEFNLNALLDEIPESYWINAAAGSGTIVVDSHSNSSLYLYVITQLSNYLEIRFL